MSWNGVGVFNRIYSWVADKNANIDITASRMDTDTDDITSNGFGNCLTRDGQGSATANLPMNSFRHTGAGLGVATTDYATMGQLQGGSVTWAVATGTSDALAASYSPSITALVDGQLCFVRAASANATTTPTFSPSGLTAEVITKIGGSAVAIGDIPNAGAELILRYNLASTRWELLNPATVKGTTFWAGAAGGTGNAITLTDPNFNLQDGYLLSFRATAANSAATTIAVSGGSAISIVKDTAAGPTALVGTEIETGNIVTLAYDANASEFHISAPLTLIGAGQLLSSALGFNAPINLALYSDNTTAGSNLLFVAVKGANGSDPSATNPVLIPFRSATTTLGTPTYLTVTAALSIDTHATGATLGAPANAAFRFWFGCFNNAGTPQLALRNCYAGGIQYPLDDRNAQSTMAMSSGATSAGVWYTENGVTVSSKEVCVLGYVEYNSTGLVTPGTYATAPNFVQLAGPNTPRPGARIQGAFTPVGATFTSANNYTPSATAPTTAAGVNFASQAITPTSAANLLRVSGKALLGTTATAQSDYTLFLTQDSGVTALMATGMSAPTGSTHVVSNDIKYQALAQTIGSTTFKLWAASQAGTVNVNTIAAGSAFYAGNISTYIEVEEIMT